MEGAHRGLSAAKRPAERRPSPLVRLNRQLARPIAGAGMVMGIAPGQLSIQSLTFTIAGLARMADGQWKHLVVGSLLVYLALLLDNADTLIGQRKGRPGTWTLFLGLTVDRLVEVAIIVGLGVISVRSKDVWPIPAWEPFSASWILVLSTAAIGLMMASRSLQYAADSMLMREHLLKARRLPGPSAIPRYPPVYSVIERLAGRDETILLWCVGVALGQLELTLLVMVAFQALLLVERVILFNRRLRDPEVEASRILGPDYP